MKSKLNFKNSIKLQLKNCFSNLRKDKNAQVSLEFILIVGIVILVAITVGFYLKQLSAKNTKDATDLQDKVLDE
ncbi:MAG: class III signal peptide-containing protein [archaeon]